MHAVYVTANIDDIALARAAKLGIYGEDVVLAEKDFQDIAGLPVVVIISETLRIPHRVSVSTTKKDVDKWREG